MNESKSNKYAPKLSCCRRAIERCCVHQDLARSDTDFAPIRPIIGIKSYFACSPPPPRLDRVLASLRPPPPHSINAYDRPTDLPHNTLHTSIRSTDDDDNNNTAQRSTAQATPLAQAGWMDGWMERLCCSVGRSVGGFLALVAPELCLLLLPLLPQTCSFHRIN